jgi:hypothetical protein
MTAFLSQALVALLGYFENVVNHLVASLVCSQVTGPR